MGEVGFKPQNNGFQRPGIFHHIRLGPRRYKGGSSKPISLVGIQGAYIPEGLRRKCGMSYGRHWDWPRAWQKQVQTQRGTQLRGCSSMYVNARVSQVRIIDQGLKKRLCRVRTWGHKDESDFIPIQLSLPAPTLDTQQGLYRNNRFPEGGGTQSQSLL